MSHPGRAIEHAAKPPARRPEPQPEPVGVRLQTAIHMTPVPGLVHENTRPAAAPGPARRSPQQRLAALRRTTTAPLPGTAAHTGTTASVVIRRLATQITLGPAPAPVATETTTVLSETGSPDDDATMTPDPGGPSEVTLRPDEQEMTIVPDDEPNLIHPTMSSPLLAEHWAMHTHEPTPDGPGRPMIITEIAIVGRPKKLFGSSMGDHTTSFGVHRKGLENGLLDQTLDAGIDHLTRLITDMQQLPGWERVPNAGRLREEFRTAKKHLKRCQAALAAAGTDDLKVVRLQETASAYLELRETLPFSVVDWKGAGFRPGGRGGGESGMEGFLTPPGQAAPGHLTRDFFSSLDSRRLAEVALQPDPIVLAKLMPGMDPSWDTDERLTQLATQHVRSVQLNFPEAFPSLAAELRGPTATRTVAGAVADGAPARVDLPPVPGSVAMDVEATPAGPETAGTPTSKQDFDCALAALKAKITSLFPSVAAAERANHLVQARLARDSGRKTRKSDFDAAMRFADSYLPHLAEADRKAAIEAAPRFAPDEVKLRADGRPARSNAGRKKSRDVQPDPPTKPREPKKKRKQTKKRPREEVSELSPVDLVDPAEDSDLSPAAVVDPSEDAATSRPTKKARLAPPDPEPERATYYLPTHYLAVQLVIDKTGAISKLLVARAGEHVKGAHTIPWMDWVRWMADDVRGLPPDQALAKFRTTTLPMIQTRLDGLKKVAPPTEAASSLEKPSKVLSADVEMEGPPSDDVTSEPMPLMQLQVEIKAALEKISSSENVSNMEAVDMGGKSESPIRNKLRDHETRGTGTKDALVTLLIGLVDVAELDQDVARGPVATAMKNAQTEFPGVWKRSGLDLARDLEKLVDRATQGSDQDFVA